MTDVIQGFTNLATHTHTRYLLTSDWFINNGIESCLGVSTCKSKSNANEQYHLCCSVFMADRKLFKEKLCAKITSSFFYVSQTMESNGLMLQLAHSLSHGTIPLKFVLNKAKVMWESTLLA